MFDPKFSQLFGDFFVDGLCSLSCWHRWNEAGKCTRLMGQKNMMTNKFRSFKNQTFLKELVLQ